MPPSLIHRNTPSVRKRLAINAHHRNVNEAKESFMNAPPSSHVRQAGFTIIELMTVVIIVGILAAIAVPSFTEAVTRNRIISQNNELIASFSYARLEGIRRNQITGVCALDSAETGCAADDWSRGWLVWVDTDRNNAFTTADEVLRINQLSSNDSLTGTDLNITFGARGTRQLPAAGAAAPTLVLQPNACATAKNNIKTLTINSTGSTTSVESTCP